MGQITKTDEDNVTGVIDTWDNSIKFTWSNLIDAVKNKHKASHTRQAYTENETIYKKYSDKKDALRDRKSGKKKVRLPASLKIAAERIEALEEKNAALEKENEMFHGQFLVWQYNAYAHGLNMEELNRPMPAKMRKVTEDEEI